MSAPTASTRIPLILGAGQIGLPGSDVKVSDAALVQAFVDLMLKHGHVGVDTARVYGGGTSEQLIGGLDFRGIARVDTKALPAREGHPAAALGGHTPEKLKANFKASVEALNGKKIRVFYLHAPERTTPFEVTLEAVNELHQAGGFEEFGLSNYKSWEVAEIVGICRRRGFVLPTVYEGEYNPLDRLPEVELFDCLRKFNIRFAAYSVLAGGYLSDRFFVPDEANSKDIALANFDPKATWAWFYTSRYLPMAPAVVELEKVVKAHGISLNEMTLRWLQWHSALQPGDHGIIVAASREKQLQETLAHSEKGPLPDEVVQAIDDLWKKVKGVATHYWQ